MRYFIENQCIFDSQQCTLSANDGGGSIFKLTALQAKVLTCLLINNGKPVCRDTLLASIGELDGVNPGNNLLNHNIRHLRSVLYQLCPREVIFTLHGTGYIFRGVVDTSIESELEIICTEKIKNKLCEISPGTVKAVFRMLYLLMAIAVVFFFIKISQPFVSHSLTLTDRSKFYAVVSNCKLYSMQNTRAFNEKYIKGIIEKIIISNGIVCGRDDVLFFFVQEHVNLDVNPEEISFLSMCNIKDSLWDKCFSWYVHPEGEPL